MRLEKISRDSQTSWTNTTRALAATAVLWAAAGMSTAAAQDSPASIPPAPELQTAPQTVAELAPSTSSSSLDARSADAGGPVLPDAPTPQDRPVAHGTTVAPAGGQHTVSLHSEYVPAGWNAPRLTAHDKVVAGVEDLYSLENLAAIPISAAYEYIVNSEPNYSPSDAFGKRVGAAAIRETTQSAFSEIVFAPLLHEDSRYYQKGDGHGFIPRTLYAITRPLITRTDNGTQTINGALLLGYAGAAALTPAYYPSINRNFHDTASTFGGSIGGAALGFFVSEFSDDALRALHLRRSLK